jgi:hypothetical protein
VVRNDLYLVVDDHRAEVRHAPEVRPGPDEAVRAAVRRSGAKTMAIDELPENDVRPPDSSIDDQRDDLRRSRRRLQRVEGLLDDAVARRDGASESLDHLPISTPGIRRRVKAQQSELLAAAERDIATITPVVGGLRTRCSNLEQEIRLQIISAERHAFRDELLMGVDAAPSRAARDATELDRTESTIDLSL